MTTTNSAERGREEEPCAPTQTVWSCKIGRLGSIQLPLGADSPMRQAIQAAFLALTGEHAEFTFSGWAAKLDEHELAVVQDRAAVARLESSPPLAREEATVKRMATQRELRIQVASEEEND